MLRLPSSKRELSSLTFAEDAGLDAFFSDQRIDLGAQTFPDLLAQANGTILSGTVYAAVAKVIKSGTYSNVNWVCTTTFTTVTDLRIGIWDDSSTNALLGSTANLGNVTAGLTQSALSAGVTLIKGQIVYIGIAGYQHSAGAIGCISGRATAMHNRALPRLGSHTRGRGATGWTGGTLPSLDKTAQSSTIPWIELVT